MKRVLFITGIFIIIIVLLLAGCQNPAPTSPSENTPTPTTAAMETTTNSPSVATPTPTQTSKTYFVKNGGNDSASGLSDAEAWATLRKVQNSHFNPGDSILLKCGSTWNERLDFPSSGAPGKTILFSSYGSGDQPKMMRLYLSWKSYLTVSNIYILANRDYESLFIINCNNIIIDSLTADGQKIMECDRYSLVMLYQSHHITVRNSMIKDGGNHIGSTMGGGLYVYNDCHDILVENNLVYNHAEFCIQCGVNTPDPYQDYNLVFRGNTCYNEEGYFDDCRGINVGWKCYNVIVENNKVYNTKTMLIGADADLYDAIIRNNLLFYTVEDGYSQFITILANSYGDSSNISVYNNSMFHTSRTATGAFIRLDTYDGKTSSGHKIFNNLCVTYNPDVAFIFDNRFFDYNNDTRFASNIQDTLPPEFTSDYNLFYSMVSPGKFMYQDVEYYGIDAWRAASGQDTHSIYTNPLFKGIEDFTAIDKFGTSGSEFFPNTSFNNDTAGWGCYFDPNTGASGSFSRTTAAGEYYTAPGAAKISCTTNGNVWYSIQLFNDNALRLDNHKWYVLSFKAKATSQFKIPAILLMKKQSPWTYYALGDMGESPMITTDWQTYHVFFYTNQAASDARINWDMGTTLPAGATFYIDDISFKLADGLNQTLPDIEDFITPGNSPCVGAGIALTDVIDDYLGNHRPEGAGYDIGAYEVR